MRSFKGYVSTDNTGSEYSFEFEVEDDASVEEVNAVAREAALEHVEWSYYAVIPPDAA